MSESDQNSNMWFLRNEFLKNFEPFQDDVNNRYDSYLLSNEELIIKPEDLKLTLVTIGNMLAVTCSLENYSD